MALFTDYTIGAEVTDEGGGRLVFSDDEKEAYRKALRHFKRGRVTVRLEVDRGKRSSQANRYYRLVLGLIADETGHDVDELHAFYKHKFMTPAVREVFGREIEIWTTVTDADAFHAYVENVRRHALMELGVATPDPDPALRGRSRHAKRSAA